MQRNTSVTLGAHLSNFVQAKIQEGRYESTSEAVREGLRLLEERETKLDILRERLACAESALDAGKGSDGEAFMKDLIG